MKDRCQLFFVYLAETAVILHKGVKKFVFLMLKTARNGLIALSLEQVENNFGLLLIYFAGDRKDRSFDAFGFVPNSCKQTKSRFAGKSATFLEKFQLVLWLI